jgi:predicted deacylase
VKFVNEHILSSTEVYKKSFELLLKNNLLKNFEDNKWEITRAQRLNMILQLESQNSDIVLDLHTDSEAITYLYTPQFSKKDSDKFGYKHTLVIPDNKSGTSLDEATFTPWVKLRQEFANQRRKEDVLKQGYTLEFGSEENISSEDAISQSQGVLNYLSHKCVINSPHNTDALSKEVIHHDIDDYIHVKALEGGLYDWLVNPGDFVKKDSVVAEYIQTSTMTKQQLTFPFDVYIISIHTRGAVCQGSPLTNIAVVR